MSDADYIEPLAAGMVQPGNLDPYNRPILQNEDGSYSTTSSISVGTDAGETLIPTVVDGKRLSEEDAIAHFRETGGHFGIFATPEAADAFAEQMHNDQAARGPGAPPALFDPQTAARAAGYSWAEIKDHIASATATALHYGYGEPEIDAHLGYQDPTRMQERARQQWAGTFAADPAILDTIEPQGRFDLAASPTARGDYAAALINGEVKSPQDFADRYASAAMSAAHDVFNVDSSNAQAVQGKQAIAAFAADVFAPQLPTTEDLTDAALMLAGNDPATVGGIRQNLLDHWRETGQEPLRAAMQAQADPALSMALTARDPEAESVPLSALTDPAIEFAKGFVSSVTSLGYSIGHISAGAEEWLAKVSGNTAFQARAAKDIADLAHGEAAAAKLLEPNRKDASTFVARTLGGATGAVGEYSMGGIIPTAMLYALHGADVAYRETGDLAAAAVGATIEGAIGMAPIHVLQGNGGVVQNAVRGVLTLGAIGGAQTFTDPLPAYVAGHGYTPPTLSQVAEGAAAGGIGGALLGVVGAMRPIRVFDPAKGAFDAIQEITPERLIADAAEQSPHHEAAARLALMEPAERQQALDEMFKPPEPGSAPTQGPTPQEARAQVEELIPAYEGAHDLLRYLRGLSADVLKDITGAVELYHGSGVVFAAERGAPFGRFQLQKVGAGEGAQLYGWGLYFAQDPKIAEWYRDADLKRKGTPEGSLFTVKVDAEPHQLLDWDAKLTEQPKAVQDAVTKALGEWATPTPPPAAGMVRFYHGAKSGEAPTGQPRWVSDRFDYAKGYATEPGARVQRGRVFYTDIPEDHPLLENKKSFEDAGTSMKSPYVHFEVPAELANWKEFREPRDLGDMTGEALFKRLMQEKGASVAETNSMTGTSNRAASEALLAEGLRGLRYADASTRNLPLDQRSLNHVIFDPAAISITHRNGEPIPNRLFSLIMPLLSGPVNRVGAAMEAITSKMPLRTPEQIVRHHLNQASRDDVQKSIISETGQGNRTLADFANRLDSFHRLVSPHVTEWERALASKDPAKMQSTVIGNFLAYVEGRTSGAELGNSALKPLADVMRTVNMEMYNKLEQAAVEGKINRPGFIDDYFRHLWKDPRGPEWEAMRREGVGRQGSQQSLRERSIPTTAEGLAAGLIPKISDPIDLMMFDLGQKIRYLHATEILSYGKELGYVYYAGGRRDPNDIALTGAATQVGPNGSIRAWAPAGFAKSYNNWLDAGLYGHPSTATTYEKLLWMTNTMTGMKLALPTFHSMVVGLASWSSTFSRAMQELARGQLGRSALDFASAATVFGPMVSDAVRGTRALRDYARMADDPVIQYLTEAGLRFGPRQSVYRFGPESFQQAWKRGGMAEIFRDLGKDVRAIAGDPVLEANGYRLARIPDRVLQWPIRWLGRVMNTITDPLFDHAIPALKVGAAYHQLESWMAANKGAAPEAVWARAREIVKDVDNRFGELNQDTLFWRRSVKQAANVSLVSTGWVYGSYRGFLGALGVNIERGRFEWNPTVTASTVGTAVGFMYANAIMQYLHTGTAPWQTNTQWQDLLNFRTGGLTAQKTPERGMLPSELKEIFDLYKAVSFAVGTGAYSEIGPATLGYALAKVNPFFQMIRTALTGEDAIGHKVAFTPGGWGKYMGEMVTPIVVDQLMHRRVGTQISVTDAVMGIREAARYVEDPLGYQKTLQGLSARWTKDELARARKEAIALGQQPPPGSAPLGRAQSAHDQRLDHLYDTRPSAGHRRGGGENLDRLYDTRRR